MINYEALNTIRARHKDVKHSKLWWFGSDTVGTLLGYIDALTADVKKQQEANELLCEKLDAAEGDLYECRNKGS